MAPLRQAAGERSDERMPLLLEAPRQARGLPTVAIDEHHRPFAGHAIGSEEDTAGDVAQHPARVSGRTQVHEQHIAPLLEDEQRRERGRVIRVPHQSRPPAAEEEVPDHVRDASAL